jgi:cytochrome oxidase Cu insertion factor (SCO1/SenC/PrrC family)
MNESNQPEPRARRSTRPLWILIAIMVLPYIAGWLYFHNRDVLQLGGQGNEGDLVTPVRPLGALPLDLLGEESTNTAELKGKWVLVTVASSDCNEACLRNLFFLRQVRKAMADGRFRVERLLVLTDDSQLSALPGKLGEFEGTRVVTGPADTRDRLLKMLQVNGITDPTGARFIVDPLGNLMMSYRPDSDPEDMAEDLRRLLSLSRIG